MSHDKRLGAEGQEKPYRMMGSGRGFSKQPEERGGRHRGRIVGLSSARLTPASARLSPAEAGFSSLPRLT